MDVARIDDRGPANPSPGGSERDSRPAARLLQEFTEPFAGTVAKATHQLSPQAWLDMMARGTFYEAALFTARAVPLLPAKVRQTVLSVLEDQAGGLLSRSSWYSLATGHEELLSAPGGPGAVTLLARFTERVRAVDVARLPELSLLDRIHCVSCCGAVGRKHRPPSCRRCAILSEAEQRSLDIRERVALQLLLALGRSPQVPAAEAQRLFSWARQRLDAAFFKEFESRPLFQHLWQLVAFWYDRIGSVSRPQQPFSACLSEQERAPLFKKFAERIGSLFKQTDEEQMRHRGPGRSPGLALAGPSTGARRTPSGSSPRPGVCPPTGHETAIRPGLLHTVGALPRHPASCQFQRPQL